MRFFSVKQIIVLCVLLLALTVAGSAQAIKMHVFVFDTALPTDTVTLLFGFDPTATRGIDASLGEYELPPPAFGFDARWTNTDLAGGSPLDYRTTPTDPARIDTFAIAISNSDASSADFGVMWNHAYFASICDSMSLKIPAGSDADGNPIPSRKINMLQADSALIPASQDWGIKKYTILVRLIPTGVIEIPGQIPAKFGLGQNYPNPFNPSTTIKFDIARTAMTEIAVYNILGQKISTLVSQELKPGSYSTLWNGTSNTGNSISTGVYFVRMSARALDNGAEQFSALQKVLLMK